MREVTLSQSDTSPFTTTLCRRLVRYPELPSKDVATKLQLTSVNLTSRLGALIVKRRLEIRFEQRRRRQQETVEMKGGSVCSSSVKKIILLMLNCNRSSSFNSIVYLVSPISPFGLNTLTLK